MDNTYLIQMVLAVITIVILIILLIQSMRGDFSGLVSRLTASLAVLEKNQERTTRAIQDEIARSRDRADNNARQLRDEVNTSLKMLGDSLLARHTEHAVLQKNQLDTFTSQINVLTSSNMQKLDQMRDTFEERLMLLQQDNNQKLEQMRATVDEKLHKTLEKRLNESFRLVSDRLELVHQGLGEMQSLAAGVGDLKKVLTNVKTRGVWGEISLACLLEQVLTNEQYDKNVVTKKGSAERVEFAIKLPGRDGDRETVWLPIDAKFPQEDYLRLIEAQEQADPVSAEKASRQLAQRIKVEAKNIRTKYIDPPHTTDFGIMFLPTEGLYAEIIRRAGLCEMLLRDFRVIVAGPTTLSALLNSLQVGFQTLAIEKRSSEVWALLGAVKGEFGKFSLILEKTQKKLQEASNTINSAARKSRTIERKLKNVQELPATETVDHQPG